MPLSVCIIWGGPCHRRYAPIIAPPHLQSWTWVVSYDKFAETVLVVEDELVPAISIQLHVDKGCMSTTPTRAGMIGLWIIFCVDFHPLIAWQVWQRRKRGLWPLEGCGTYALWSRHAFYLALHETARCVRPPVCPIGPPWILRVTGVVRYLKSNVTCSVVPLELHTAQHRSAVSSQSNYNHS